MGYGSVNVNIFWAPWGFFGPRRGFSMMEVEPLGTLGSVGAPGGLVYVDFLVGWSLVASPLDTVVAIATFDPAKGENSPF